MPKTPVKTFLMLLHKLNNEMDHFATIATTTLQRIENLDEFSVTEPADEDDLRTTYLDCQSKFHQIMDMKNVLMSGLRRKVMESMSDKSASKLVTRSATMRRSNGRSRKTLRRYSL